MAVLVPRDQGFALPARTAVEVLFLVSIAWTISGKDRRLLGNHCGHQLQRRLSSACGSFLATFAPTAMVALLSEGKSPALPDLTAGISLAPAFLLALTHVQISSPSAKSSGALARTAEATILSNVRRRLAGQRTAVTATPSLVRRLRSWEVIVRHRFQRGRPLASRGWFLWHP